MPLSHAHIWKALDALAAREGLSPSGLARQAGLDPTSFNPSKRFGLGSPPRPRWPSTESLNQVLEATGLSLQAFANLADGLPEIETIPHLGLAQAGTDGFFDEAGLPLAEGWDQTALPRSSDSLLSLEISGDSMTPLYRQGDRIIVDLASIDVRRGDRVVVRTLSGETLAKEITALSPTNVTLSSINPAYPPRVLPRREVQWMARILWVSQ